MHFYLKEYLSKPSPRNRLTLKQKNLFNYRLSRARRIVLNAFGILAVTVSVTPMPHSPEKVVKILKTCCVLNNCKPNLQIKQYVYTADTNNYEGDAIVPGNWMIWK